MGYLDTHVETKSLFGMCEPGCYKIIELNFMDLPVKKKKKFMELLGPSFNIVVWTIVIKGSVLIV